MLDIKILRNIPSELYVGIYGNGMVSIYKETMDYFSKHDGITMAWGMTKGYISSSRKTITNRSR